MTDLEGKLQMERAAALTAQGAPGSPEKTVAVEAKEAELVAKEAELAQEQSVLGKIEQAAADLKQKQGMVEHARVNAEAEKQLALKQRASVVRDTPEQLQLQQRRAVAFAHHVSAFASTEQPTVGSYVTSLDMRRPLAKDQLKETVTKELEMSSRSDAVEGVAQRFALFCSGRLMLLPVAQEKQQESWLHSIGQMQSMQEAVNASKPIACNKPKYSIIVVSAALLARDFQGCTLQECMSESATDGAMETEVQRKRTAVQQAFQGMLGCLAANGRILVHMDPTLDDPMERQERRIAEATSALACYSGQLLFSCRPDEAMHYAIECIRSGTGHKSRQSQSCVDQRITSSMENHARIVAVGHKDAIWKTKLQPCECTSPQGEHGSTRVSWQEQLRATDPVDAKEVLASLQTRGDNVFSIPVGCGAK